MEISLASDIFPKAMLDMAFQDAFAEVARVHLLMSRHEAESELSQFNRLACHQWLTVSADTLAVFAFANELSQQSAGLFDLFTTSHDPQSGCWSDLEVDIANRRLRKHQPLVADLGGIAKGYAVDCAVQALKAHGAGGDLAQGGRESRGFVNAGGDARVFGELELPLQVRHPLEAAMVMNVGTLANAAVATSVLDRRTSQTVVAPSCMVADALTKIVFVSGDAQHPLLAKYDARSWIVGGDATILA